MNRSKLMSLALALLMLMSLLLANVTTAAAASEIPQIRFRHWYNEADPSNRLIYTMIQNWIDENSDKVNIVQEISVGDDSKTQLYIDIASDTVPEAFCMWGNPNSATAFVEAGIVLDINEYFAVGANKYEDYDTDIFARTKVLGVQTVIPLEGWSSYWFANKALFDKYGLEIPTTWDELFACAEVFKANNVITFAMGSKAGNPSYEVFAELYNQLPNAVEELKAMSTDFVINTENWMTLFDRLTEMRDGGLWPQDTVGAGDWGAMLGLYNSGNCAIFQGYTWQLKDFNPDLVANTVKISPIKMPECVLDVDNYQRTGCDYGLMLSKKAWEDPAIREQLILLADFIGSEEFLMEKFYANGEFPTRASYEIDESRITIPMMATVIADKANRPLGGENFLWLPGNNVKAVMVDAFDEFTAGAIEGDEVVALLQEAMNDEKDRLGGVATAD